MSDGSWKPLTSKELTFTTDYGTFDGNDLVLPQHTKMTKVTITVTLKSDVKKTQSKVIAIKQLPDPPLPAYDRDTEMRPRKKNVTLI